jgi:hypothetical protein
MFAIGAGSAGSKLLNAVLRERFSSFCDERRARRTRACLQSALEAPAANSSMPFFGNGFHRSAMKEEPEELL